MADKDYLAKAEVDIDPPPAFSKRLVNFKTGHAELTSEEHKKWLRELASLTNTTREFTCHLYGFASKLGNPHDNLTLSYNRANSVVKFLEELNPLFTTRTDSFTAKGDKYVPISKDPNDPHFRAVEVHVYWGKPPKVPPGIDPNHPPKTRTGMDWGVTNKAVGFQTNIVHDLIPAQIGFNLFAFKNNETGATETFLALLAGAGTDLLTIASGIISQLKAAKNAKVGKLSAAELDKLLSTLGPDLAERKWPSFFMTLFGLTSDSSWSPTDFQRAKVFTPTTFGMLDGATIANASAQVGHKASFAALYVYGSTWYEEKPGKKMYGSRNFLEVPGSWNTQFQVPNLGASFVGGPLIRLKWKTK